MNQWDKWAVPVREVDKATFSIPSPQPLNVNTVTLAGDLSLPAGLKPIGKTINILSMVCYHSNNVTDCTIDAFRGNEIFYWDQSVLAAMPIGRYLIDLGKLISPLLLFQGDELFLSGTGNFLTVRYIEGSNLFT